MRLLMMILTMILVFVVYFLAITTKTALLDKETLESHFLERVWTVIPMLILLAMAYPSLMMLYFMEAREGSNLDYNIKVVAHQWYWEFEFLVHFAEEAERFDMTLNLNPRHFYTLETGKDLHLPLNQVIALYVTSADVLHAFTVPSLGVKVDAIPGRINVLNFRVNLPGVYYGQCSEICGANHSFMPISVKAY